MKKREQILEQLEDSDEERYLPIPAPPGHFERKGSSGCFQLPGEEPTSEYIETSRGSILVLKNQHKQRELNVQDWTRFFSEKEEADIIVFGNAIHSVVRGLDDDCALELWERCCSQAAIQPARLKQTKGPFKYQQEIQQALCKLEKNYIGIGFTAMEMKAILPEVASLLNGYTLEDPQVGYSRGMEYLAFGIVHTAFLHPKSREQLLAKKMDSLSHIMRKLHFRGIYLPSKPMIFSKTKKLQERLKVDVPELTKRLGDVDYTKVFYKYYLSLFLYSNTHKVLVSRLMELLLLEGEDFVTYLLVRITKECEQDLLKLPPASLEGRLRNDLFRSYFFKVADAEALRLLEGLMIWRTDCTM